MSTCITIVVAILGACTKMDSRKPNEMRLELILSDLSASESDKVKLGEELSRLLLEAGNSEKSSIKFDNTKVAISVPVSSGAAKAELEKSVAKTLESIGSQKSILGKVSIDASQRSKLKHFFNGVFDFPISIQADSVDLKTGENLLEVEQAELAKLMGSNFDAKACFFVVSYLGARPTLEYRRGTSKTVPNSPIETEIYDRLSRMISKMPAVRVPNKLILSINGDSFEQFGAYTFSEHKFYLTSEKPKVDLKPSNRYELYKTIDSISCETSLSEAFPKLRQLILYKTLSRLLKGYAFQLEDK